MTERSVDYLLGETPPAASDLPAEVDAATVASLCGITADRVRALSRDGAIPRRQVRGGYAYKLPDAVVAYIDWARDNPRGRRSKDPGLNDEKLRLAREQADKIALQNSRARGDLLDAAEVARRWVEYTTALRAALLAVPNRVASQTGLDRRAAAELDAELRAALDQIACEGGYTGESPSSGINTPELDIDAREGTQ